MRSHAGEIGLASVLAIWFVASIANQFERARETRIYRRVASFDWFGVIPTYRFFLPRPDGADHVLLVRARHRDASTTPWRVVWRPPPRRWWHAIFNPAGKRHKVLDSLQRELERQLVEFASLDLADQESAEGRIFPSLPYLGLLNWTTSLPDANAVATQFAVVVERSHGSTDLGSLSDVHLRIP